MIAIDTSSLVAYLAGENADDTNAVDDALGHKAALLPPVVLTELLSARNLERSVRETLLAIPMLDVTEGYWERAGLLRARLLSRRLKARLADTLIAQSCMDHGVALITRDRDFRQFAKHGGLRVVPE
ncbi:MAG TPA: PIN domain-containing protein [Terriglobia bacterium]|nr:PIN domain-containing protein [Terriglobia bacterium]